MRPLPTLIIGHLLGVIVVLFGLWWIVTNISGLPGTMLTVVFAAVTILIMNHIRWWYVGRNLEDSDVLAKMSHIVVSNYIVMVLFLALLVFKSS